MGFLPRSKGFTLVEIAIVITIIALLTGGVLKGNQLLTLARVQALIKQMNEVSAVTQAFQDSYNMWPGDMALAQQRIANCSPATWCYNGNGNGKVGPEWQMWPFLNNFSPRLDAEDTNFWTHLTYAGFITQHTPDGTISSGHSHLAGKSSGTWVVWYPAFAGGIVTQFRGHQMSLRNVIAGQPVSFYQTKGVHALTVFEMSYIDKKMDDGNGDTGIIQAFPSYGCGFTNGEYSEGGSEKNCNLLYQMQAAR